MRILHTGDLHLDSAFCTYGYENAEMQRQSGRDLLTAIFKCAKDEKCDMLLIAGDLFDSRFVTPESSELFCRLVGEYGMPVIVSPGNHDWYSDDSFYAKVREKLGDRLTVFSSSDLQTFDFDDLKVRVFGYAFTSPVLTYSPLSDARIPNDNGYLKIFCGHADLASPISRYAPVTLSEITALGVDYAALGHIHNRKEYEDACGRVRYCGFAEGRSFDEVGEGGIWIVDIDAETCIAERRILSKKSFYVLNTDVSDCCSENDIERSICDTVKEYSKVKGAHIRVELVGRADEKCVSAVALESDNIAKSNGIEYLEIVDGTLPGLDGEYLEKNTTLRGELYRTLLPKLMSDNADERRTATHALRIGLAAIDGKNVLSSYVQKRSKV